MPERAKHPLRTRILSSIALAVPAVAAIVAGWPFFHAFIAVATIVMAREWVKLCAGERLGTPELAVAGAALVSVIAASFGTIALAAALAVAGAAPVYVLAKLAGREHAAWLAFGAPYIGLPTASIVWIFGAPGDGQATVLWLIGAVAVTDIGAFFVGRAFGGPRLAPKISPKKTWAGLAGGMLCAAIVGAVAAEWIGLPSPWPLAATSAALAVIAQAGDLGESLIKRRFGVKDVGGFLPGHGGLLDRVDGVIAAALAVATFNWITGEGLLTWR